MSSPILVSLTRICSSSSSSMMYSFLFLASISTNMALMEASHLTRVPGMFSSCSWSFKADSLTPYSLDHGECGALAGDEVECWGRCFFVLESTTATPSPSPMSPIAPIRCYSVLGLDFRALRSDRHILFMLPPAIARSLHYQSFVETIPASIRHIISRPRWTNLSSPLPSVSPSLCRSRLSSAPPRMLRLGVFYC